MQIILCKSSEKSFADSRTKTCWGRNRASNCCLVGVGFPWSWMENCDCCKALTVFKVIIRDPEKPLREHVYRMRKLSTVKTKLNLWTKDMSPFAKWKKKIVQQIAITMIQKSIWSFCGNTHYYRGWTRAEVRILIDDISWKRLSHCFHNIIE